MGVALDTGQIEQVIERNILPVTADNRVLEAKFLVYSFLLSLYLL
jgi:hypothetical protein